MLQGLQKMPIWRDANALLLAIEQAVRHFPRYHKYAIGQDLRRQAMLVCRLIAEACRERQARSQRVQRLNACVDDLKIQIQLAKELQAFRHFTEFQQIAELAVAVGKQSGAWKRASESVKNKGG